MRLGQEINWVMERGDRMKNDSVLMKMMANKMAINLDMLVAFVVTWILHVPLDPNRDC